MRESQSAARALWMEAWAARTIEALRSLRLPGRLRDRRAGPALAALGVVSCVAVLGAWWLARRAPAAASFPRRADEMAAEALDARLVAALERLESDPEDIQDLLEAGTLHFLKGREHYRAAINQLETARRLGALEPRIFYYLGLMYQEVGLVPFALLEYQRFVRNFPDDREARLLLGKLLFQTGRFEEAAVQYQSLKQARGKTDPVIEENLGVSLLALNRLDEAAKSFEPLLGLAEYEPRARFHLGRIAVEQGRYGQARAHLEFAARAAPAALAGIDPSVLWTLLASNAEKLQAWPLAKESWERVLKLDPKSAKAKNSLRGLAPKLRALKKPAPKAPKPQARPKNGKR